MPILAAAHEIIVIEIEGCGTHSPSGQDLARSIEWHGPSVAVRILPDPHGRAGGAVLSAATATGCDLLIFAADVLWRRNEPHPV
jgi:hypothetical protein